MARIKKVSILIVSWNGREHLETCLPALAEQLDPGVASEVLVLDSGSSDGTGAWIKAHHPGVRLLRSEINVGFCAGNNRLAESAEGDALILLNNDTRPPPHWLGTLVEALASAPEDVAAVAGKMVDWEGERLDFARGLMTFDGHALQQDCGRPLGGVALPRRGEELLFACAGNMIVRRDAYLAAGGFDEAYFGYYEDVDLGWRFWLAGSRVVFEPGAWVYHRARGTSERFGNANRGFLFERNAFLTVYKNYQAGWLEHLLPAILLTIQHRNQSLLVQNNPGAEQLTWDPYRGHIANTGPQTEAGAERPAFDLGRKWRELGAVEFCRGAARRSFRTLLPGRPVPAWLRYAPPPPRLTDDRTVAHLRAVTQLLAHLDGALERRQAVQARRRRSDAEIFERFPLWVIPTYPGDERLFASQAFRSLLGADLPLRHARLEEVMRVDGMR